MADNSAQAAESLEARAKFTAILFSAVDMETATSFSAFGVKGIYQPDDALPAFFAQTSGGSSPSEMRRSLKRNRKSSETTGQGRLMLGMEQSFPQNLFFSFSFGPSIARIEKSHIPGYEIHRGMVMQIDAWWRPNKDIAFNLTTIGDSAEVSLWSRLRITYQTGFQSLSIGPEMAASMGRDWYKLKLGMHLSGIKLMRYEFLVNGGWITDEKHRNGGYAGLTTLLRY